MEQLVVDQPSLQRDLNAHGTDAQLELYALGRLPESDLAALEEHLLVCARCREQLDGLRDFVLGVREAAAPSGTLSAPRAAVTSAGLNMNSRLASFFRRPAVSMGLAFVVLLLGLAIFSKRNQVVSVAALQLTARGAMPVADPARSIDLKLADAPGEGGPFRVEVVNAADATVWANLAESTPSGVELRVPIPVSSGDYFVRLYSASGAMLREYRFRIR